ncbi:WEB family protein At1g75720-like [Miscanthus floridulus]|uniref:WEB family protein At1g75720-like n=1 Tax=Miscanthus floridulus TaxID=154761 RepID=UPI003458D61A
MVTQATVASRAEVDTSRPFQSVREAVEVFGERRHAGGNGSSSNESSAPPAAASPSSVMLECLKKLEEDLAEAKVEVVELRQRQAQMEVAVSSLSVQFSKGLAVYSSLSKGKEVAVVVGDEDSGGHGRVRSDRWDESRAEEWVASLEYLPSLSEALAIKMVEDDQGDRKERKVVKKSKNKAASARRTKKHKSGISLQLVGGMFCSKKATSSMNQSCFLA